MKNLRPADLLGVTN